MQKGGDSLEQKGRFMTMTSNRDITMEEEFIRKSVPESYLEAVQKYEECLSDDSAHEESKDEEFDWDITDSKKWEERDKKNRQAKQERLKERNDEIKRLTALCAQSKNQKERSESSF